jgi:hypothetical protein
MTGIRIVVVMLFRLEALDHYSTITQRFRPFYNLMPACHFINIFQREADMITIHCRREKHRGLDGGKPRP